MGAGLERVPEDVLGMGDLRVLSLVGNLLGMLPELDLPALERLYVAQIGLALVPESIGRLARLRTLDLGHNHLASLPDSLAGLRELEILYLHDNRLGVLPDWIGELPSLTYLNVAENGLGELPALAGLSALLELRAMHNRLAEIPSLPRSLRELHLRGNQLTAVPEAIRGLPELRLLDLRQNRLAGRLPDWLAELPRLEKLDLRWNAFDDPPLAPALPGCVVLSE
jgi:Leucine-rich repeat (LRR) protein